MFQKHLKRIIDGLNETEEKSYKTKGYSIPPDKWVSIIKNKYIYINCGTSGAFMVERETGELYNIKAYGVIDKNKKKKADIGNITTVCPIWLHSKRYNYLR